MSEATTPREMIECAKINLENLTTAVPVLKAHPFFVITMDQLNSAVEMLGRDMVRHSKLLEVLQTADRVNASPRLLETITAALQEDAQ